MVLRYITADMPRLESLGLPEIADRSGDAQARTGADGRRHRLGQVDHARGDDQSPQRELPRITSSRSRIRSSSCTPTSARSSISAKSAWTPRATSARCAASCAPRPDVILIGEIRDRESMQAAINLAGTGHLVLATLHANNCAETLDRIINMFPLEQHKQVMLDLSQYLRAILAQRLVMGKDGKRVPRWRSCSTRRISPSSSSTATWWRSRKRSAPAATRRPQLRRGAAPALQGRPHRPGRGADQRRFARNLEAKINFG